VLVTGDWLTVLFFGAGGEGTEWILAALAASAMMNGISTVAGNGLWAIDQPRPSFIADLASMTITLLVAAVCVPFYGALGAAVATLAGMAVAASVRVFLLIRCLRSADCVPRSHHGSEIAGDEDSRFVMESAEAAI
jgi:O-antigen/teichoic acid export membrane protein